MKLVFCPFCQDLFKLNMTMRSCECGKCYGRYLDNSKAEVSEKAISVGIDNDSLHHAIKAMITRKVESDNQASGEHYSMYGAGLFTAWARPNEGPGNPNTRVIPKQAIHTPCKNIFCKICVGKQGDCGVNVPNVYCRSMYCTTCPERRKMEKLI